MPFSTRLRSDAGAQATLDEFFRLCDAAGRRVRVLRRTRPAGSRRSPRACCASPVEVTFPDGTTELFDYSLT